MNAQEQPKIDLSKREDEVTQLNREVSRLNREVIRLKGEVTTLTNNLETEKSTVRTLNENLRTEQGKVKTLTKERDDEQGKKRLWCWLSWCLAVILIMVTVYNIDPLGWRKPRSVTYTPTPSQLKEYEKKYEAGEEVAREIYDEISAEMSRRFGITPESLYADFTFDADSEWAGKKLSAFREPEGVLMYTDDFVQKFNALAKKYSLERAKDGSNFSIDVKDGGSFDLRKTLEGLFHHVNQSNTGSSSNKDNVIGRIRERVEKSGRSYNYVRFVSKTNIDGVDELAVFSIAPNDSPRFKSLYIASGKDILIAKSDSIIDNITDKIEVKRDSHNRPFLKFTLSPSEHYLRGYEDMDSCLKKFITQFK